MTAPSSPLSQTRTSAARLGALLGSPFALALSVVALVTLVGAASTVLAYRALQREGEQRIAEVVHGHAEQLRASFDMALNAADPLLNELSGRVRALEAQAGTESLLASLRELATARPALTWVSVSFPDGSFVGVHRTEAGQLEAQTSRVAPAGVERHFSFDGTGAARLTSERPTAYDPRKRTFYQLAVARGERLWTPPYAFLPELNAGMSRVEPLYREAAGARELLAVLTVDFDASGLAGLLGKPLTPRARQLVLASDQTVLAASGLSLPPKTGRSAERPVHWAELSDQVARAAQKQAPRDESTLARSLRVAGEDWRVEWREIASLDKQPIALVSMLPESELYAGARSQALHGIGCTLLTALLGVLLASALSANIARLQRKREQAEVAVEEAREALLELGSYRLLAPLGRGGMGQVFRARHTLLARDAALKLIRTDPHRSEHELQRERLRFFDEARALASLRSVHTVAVYDFGLASDGQYFLAMELLDGLDLDKLVRGHGPQPPARVASILAQVCDSLAEAHAAGIAHRDLKPANVFLARQAEWLDLVKVLDFGLSRRIGTARVSRVEGTPGYMAPEQALGEGVGPAVDLYGVGCLGFWLLTAHAPFERLASETQLVAQVSGPLPTFPEEVRDRCPPALLQLLTRCLAKRAEHRPVSAEVLARAFRRVAEECSDTFTEDMRRAFWLGRSPYGAPLPGAAAAGDQTQSMVSVAPRSRAQREDVA